MIFLFYILMNLGIAFLLCVVVPFLFGIFANEIGGIYSYALMYVLVYLFVGIMTYLYNRYLMKKNKAHQVIHNCVWTAFSCGVYLFIHYAFIGMLWAFEGVELGLLIFIMTSIFAIINVLSAFAACWHDKIKAHIQSKNISLYFSIAFSVGLLLVSTAMTILLATFLFAIL